MKVVVCIERFEEHGITFREGETYFANMVNPHYWIVDSVGIKSDDFMLHFEVVEELVEELVEDKTSGSTVEVNKKFVEEEKEFKEFLRNFGFKDEDTEEKEEKESILDKIRDYIFA